MTTSECIRSDCTRSRERGVFCAPCHDALKARQSDLHQRYGNGSAFDWPAYKGVNRHRYYVRVLRYLNEQT